MAKISQKQLAANRQNAKKGGVKTENGKAVIKYNALKHGLLSKQVLIKNDDESLLIALGKQMRKDLNPRTQIEYLLVDRIVTNTWRLRRALGFEEDDVLTYDFEGLHKNADLFIRYETMLERGIYKALHELQRIQAARTGEKSPLPVAVDVDVSKE